MNRLTITAVAVALAAITAAPVFLKTALPRLEGNARAVKSTERVLCIGASVAEGWDDKSAGGYLIRTFQSLSAGGSVSYQVYNQAAAGDGVLQVVKKYPLWLQQVHPQVVVIAWGGLDDMHEGTPFGTVAAQVRWETQLALAHHAVVLLTTPPVTRASYVGKMAALEPGYVHHEIVGAQSVQSRNVYVMDIFNQMKAYIKSHHQTVTPYVGDGWHPNTAGHILAAQILSNNIDKVFGRGPITFH